MDIFFGLPSLKVEGVAETWDNVSVTASLVAASPCPQCGAGCRSIGNLPPLRVIDTPSRGKPTFIEVHRKRLKCGACAATYSPRGPDLDPEQAITRRARRHIERMVLRMPAAKIADEMGFGARNDRQVRDLALSLAGRLQRHRFATPEILGVDEIQLNDRLFSVLTNGRTGHALGVVDRKAGEAVRRWVAGLHMDQPAEPMIDVAKVKVLVTDLGAQNIALAKRPFGHAIHVADKWHVIGIATKALASVIKATLSELDQRGAQQRSAKGVGKKTKTNAAAADRQADAIRAVRSLLLGAREASTNVPQLALLDAVPDRVVPVLATHSAISKAYWARVYLARMYRCETIPDARRAAMAFARKMLDPALRARTIGSMKFLFRHRKIILNYFRVKETDRAGETWGVTNAPTERRNQNIRRIWEESRGLGLEMLNLRAVYEPWMLDVDIIECAGCGTFHGPLPGAGEARRRMPARDPSEIFCLDCGPDSPMAAVPTDVVRGMMR